MSRKYTIQSRARLFKCFALLTEDGSLVTHGKSDCPSLFTTKASAEHGKRTGGHRFAKTVTVRCVVRFNVRKAVTA